MMTDTSDALVIAGTTVAAGAAMLVVGLTAFWNCSQRKRGSVGPVQPCPVAQTAKSIFEDKPTVPKQSADGRITVEHLEGQPNMARKVLVPDDLDLPRGFSKTEEGGIKLSDALENKIKTTDDCRKVASFTSEEIADKRIFSSDGRNAMLVTDPDAQGQEVNIFNVPDNLDRQNPSKGLEPGADQQDLHVAPGDVLCIVAGGNVIEGKEGETWKYHYGTVIAVSGDNYLTFENYRYNEPQNWYFGLYGKGSESFHSVYAKTHEYGSRPQTKVFKVIDRPA